MDRSENITALAAALSAFQGEMPEIGLDSTVKVTMKSGGAYNFKYATFANILKHSLPVLSKHKLSVSQVFLNGALVTMLMHSSGEYISSSIPIDLQSGNMQEIGSRISYLKRYALTALICVVGD